MFPGSGHGDTIMLGDSDSVYAERRGGGGGGGLNFLFEYKLKTTL